MYSQAQHSPATPDPTVAGYFGPDSISWRLYREPLPILGGVRALLLQIAHPAVAEGVARFSNFRADALGRGLRTFSAMASIYFGDRAQAEATARRLHRVHSGIRAEAPPVAGAAPAPFVATDPGLLLWVLATLTDTTLLVFDHIPPRGLPADWRERFYEESKIAATLLGIPAEHYPADLPAFRAYFQAMLHSDLLGSTDTCREMAQAIVQHRYSPTRLVKVFAAGWLPAPLCERLGVSAGEQPEQRLGRWLGVAKVGFHLSPSGLRYAPAYHQARRRLARAAGKNEPMLGKWYDWLARRTGWPLGLPVAHR